MITFRNVSKSFNARKVLDDINLKLPDTGLVIIQGPSGCGKTTLLNILSGLLKFEGDIEVNGKYINKLYEKDMDDFRLKNYGFIFQDFKLFENESVLNNILFPLEIISGANQETKIRKCQSLVSMVGLKNSLNQNVSKLSGGEKQRVAIARALVNSPKIILADEPTGSLDTTNGKQIMEILQAVSAHSLVIVVSHDDELAKEYGNQVIKMNDGKVVDIIFQEKEIKKSYIPIAKSFYANKKSSISSWFLCHHTLSSIKQKKWRTAVCNMVTSLGLIGVGLASSLSSAISSNIKSTYSQIIDESKIAMTLKNQEKSIYGQYAASYYEISELAVKNQEYIYDIGCTYFNDFESFFPNANCIALADTAYYHPIEGISARHINEFRWLDMDHPSKIYPEDVAYLNNDQVVLALTIDMINDICFELRIERTVTSLSRYIQANELHMYFDFENIHWQYSDQQLFEVAGFTLDTKAGIYHNNHMWNEYMFEERMRFPSDDKISSQSSLPWYLKKIYYFYCYDNIEEFLRFASDQKEFAPYILELANSTYYPWLFEEIPTKDVQRVLIFANTLNSLPRAYYKIFKKMEDGIDNPVYGTNGGYSIYPSSMMYGFSNLMFFSGPSESLEETIDINTSINADYNQNIEIPDDVASGHFSQTLSGGVNFKVLSKEVDKGNTPKNYSEIIISSGLEKKLFKESGLNKEIHVGYLASQRKNVNGDIVKSFKTAELKVVGIINDEKLVIYHDDFWTIGFFQIMLGVSAFNLSINSLLVDVTNKKDIDSICQKLERAFPDIEVYQPMADINKSVNQICFYIEIALMCFSLIAVIISTLLLSICNYLYVLENKKDLGLVRCIGVNKKESRKFVVTHSVIMCLISFFLSAIELLLTSLLISYELSKQTGTGFVFSFNPIALVYMFALAFFISISSSLVIAKRVNKLDPLSALKS